MMSTYTTLMKKKKQEPEKLAVFQSQPFKIYIQQPAEKSVTVNSGQAEVKLKKEIAVLTEQVGKLRWEISVLRDTIRDLSNEKTQLQQKLDESCCLNQEVDRLRKKTDEQKVLIQQLQPCKLARLKQQVTAMKIRVRAGKGLHNRLAAAQEQLNAERRRTNAERRNLLKAHGGVRKLQQKNKDLQFQLVQTQGMLGDAENRATHLVTFREEKNCFSDATRQTLIELQGDGSVPASKCKTVIKAVAKHLFNTNLDEKDLPRLQTAINVADEGHILTKFQAAEKMLAGENLTLHTDGTSRNGKKIVGHQISLDSGETLSLCFTTVATEDSSTLLDVTVQLSQEIKDIFGADNSEEERDKIFQSLLSKLKSVVTDRAAVMKSFDQKLKKLLTVGAGPQCKTAFFALQFSFFTWIEPCL